MPKIQAKIEGKGNGIKTLIINMVDVAKALHRPPTYVTKYFGAEVGALTNWDEKEGRYIVNGVHDTDKLQNLLDGFIKKFVLCPKCDNPETVLSVKNGIIFRTCKACGHKSPCDNLHKLATFIKTNPPPKPAKLKQAKDSAAANVETSRVDASTKEEPVDGMIAPEGFADGLAEAVADVDEDDWDEEAANANRASELEGLSERVKNALDLSKSNIDEFQDPLEALAVYIELKGAELDSQSLMLEAEERGVRSDKLVAVTTQVLLAKDPQKNLQKHSQIFEAILVSDKDRLAFLGSLDRLASADPSVLKQLPAILQFSYNFDLVEEDVLCEWRINPSKKFISSKDAQLVRKAVQPFFEWLKSLGSEDDDTDDEDEE